MIKSTRIILALATVLCLFVGQTTTSYGQVSEFDNPVNDDLAQIDELTNKPETSAYDGYTVKVNGNISKSMKDDIEDADESELITENYVSVQNPEDALEFADPSQIEYIEPNYYFYADEIEYAGKFPESRPPNDPGYAKWVPIETTSSDSIDILDDGGNPEGSVTLTLSAINQWNLDLVNADAAWKNGYSGEGVTVGLIDSGLFTHLDDFDYSRVVQGANLSGKGAYTDTSDATGHGSKVASVFFSQIDNQFGNAGIADHVKVMPIKILRSKSDKTTAERFLKGFSYAKSRGVDIINISMGAYYDYKPLEDMIHSYAHDGGIVVAPVGNNNVSKYRYPASYSTVIGVGGIQKASNELGYTRWDQGNLGSNFNSSVDVVAPARDIATACSNDGAQSTGMLDVGGVGTGCSYAVPHVVALAAVAKQFSNGRINVMEFRSLLQKTSYNPNFAIKTSKSEPDKNPLDGVGRDIYYGNGMIDFERFINAMTRENTNGTTPIVPYKISYHKNGGKIHGSYNKYYHGEVEATLPTKVTKKGYRFLGWYNNEAFSGYRQYIIQPGETGTKTFYAKWKVNTYKLKYNVNKGKKLKTKSKKVTFDKKVGKLITPKRSGYNFLGWYSKKGAAYTGTRVFKAGKNVTLYAKWTKKSVVKYNPNKGTVLAYGKSFTPGKKIGKLSTPTRSGYTFKGWYTKKKGGKKITSTYKLKKNKNYTLYARWAKK